VREVLEDLRIFFVNLIVSWPWTFSASAAFNPPEKTLPIEIRGGAKTINWVVNGMKCRDMAKKTCNLT
jgi:hypothetical protein